MMKIRSYYGNERFITVSIWIQSYGFNFLVDVASG